MGNLAGEESVGNSILAPRNNGLSLRCVPLCLKLWARVLGTAWRGVALFKLSGFSETVRKGKRERGAGQGRAGQGFNHL